MTVWLTDEKSVFGCTELAAVQKILRSLRHHWVFRSLLLAEMKRSVVRRGHAHCFVFSELGGGYSTAASLTTVATLCRGALQKDRASHSGIQDAYCLVFHLDIYIKHLHNN